MSEVENIKKLKAWERLRGWLLWFVLIVLVIGFVGVIFNIVPPSKSGVVGIVTATPTAVATADPQGQTVIINNYVQPAQAPAVVNHCPIQNQQDVGYQQLVKVTGVPLDAEMQVGYEYIGCDGLVKQAVFCERLVQGVCMVLIPPVPVGRRLYLSLSGQGYAYKQAVNLADYYWQVDLGVGDTVEEILTTPEVQND